MTISQYRTVLKAIIIFLKICALIARVQLKQTAYLDPAGQLNAIDFHISKLEEELN